MVMFGWYCEPKLPLEAKAKINNRSKSLSVYVERYELKCSNCVFQEDFRFENNIKSVPMYATFRIMRYYE